MSRDAARRPRPIPRNAAAGLTDRTSFVGRERELSLVRQAFARGARLVTILGPPGAGKTRLARRYGASKEIAAEYPGGVRVVELSAARTLADVLRIVADPRDRALESHDDEIARIGTAIAARGHWLVILDNLEQLAALSPEFLPTWMDAAPETAWLVTSRQRLGLEGETLLELGGLSDADARSLFVDRARSIAVDYTLREGDRAMLTRLVRRLDRLPLCIELAAARARDLSLAQLHDALGRRFDLLRGGPRGACERQASLRAALDWSWELLDPVEREALAQCSVFSGSFSLTAAESVFDLSEHGAPWALDVIQALRDKSLLHAAPCEHLPDETRYALYEGVREYAAERLDQSGRRRAVEARFAGFFAAASAGWSRAMHGREAARVVSRIEAETDNLFAAYRAVRDSDPLIAARVALGMNALLHTRGPLEASAGVLDEAVSTAERAGEHELLVELLCATGVARYVRGRYGAARADFERALQLAVAIGDEALECEAHRGLVPSARATGDYERAQFSGEHALALGRKLGNRTTEGIAQFNLGGVLMVRGRNEEALVAFEAALAITRENGAPRPMALTLTNIGRTLDACGRRDEAAECFRTARALAEKIGDRVTTGKVMAFLAPQTIARGNFEEAEDLIDGALAIAREVGDREIDATARMHRGELALTRGDMALARVSFSDALATARRLDAAGLMQQASVLLARLDREDPSPRGARDDSARTLSAEPSGYWFQITGGERADLSRRPSLRKILAKLVEVRLSTPGAALPVRALVEAGWPGERMHAESGAERVYTAVRTLRKLGLRKALVSRDGGYLLDPGLPIAR